MINPENQQVSGYILRSGNWGRYTVTPSTYEVPIQGTEDIPCNHYILCVKYIPNDDKGDDTQIGISGSAKQGETSNHAVIREIREETTFRIRTNWTDLHIDRRWTAYFLQITNDTPVIRDPIDIDDRRDNKGRKVIAYIHGPLEVMKQKFRSFEQTASTRDEELDTLVLLPVTSIPNMHRHAIQARELAIEGK